MKHSIDRDIVPIVMKYPSGTGWVVFQVGSAMAAIGAIAGSIRYAIDGVPGQLQLQWSHGWIGVVVSLTIAAVVAAIHVQLCCESRKDS